MIAPKMIAPKVIQAAVMVTDFLLILCQFSGLTRGASAVADQQESTEKRSFSAIRWTLLLSAVLLLDQFTEMKGAWVFEQRCDLEG